jgi:hypothetical protein
MRREVGLAGVELSPFTSVRDLAGICDRSRPVKTLTERVAHEGVWRRVVAAHARMNISKELTPLRDRYTSLQDG